MALFEFKIKIKSTEKDKLKKALGLDFVKEYSDEDHFLATKPDQPKEKLKQAEGRLVHYFVRYNTATGLFEISGTDVTDDYNKVNDLKHRTESRVIKRTTEVYFWPGMDVKVSFEHILGMGQAIYFKVYGEDEAKVHSAKQHLIGMGYTKFETKTYDELAGVGLALLKHPLVWIILIITLIVLAFMIF